MRRGFWWVTVLAGCGSGLGRAGDTRFAAESAEPSSGTSTATSSTGDSPGSGSSGTTPEGSTSSGTSPTSPGSTTGGAPAPTEACYPGADGGWTTCLPVAELSPAPAEYVYPAPLDGSAQYAAPLRYLDLGALDPATALAPNFVLEEFAQLYKGQYAVVQAHFVDRVQACRDEVGTLIVNSGYRSPDYNASIGGATWSRHMYGDAADLDPALVDLYEMADVCYANGASFVSIYEAHVHCDWRDDALDAAFYGGARAGVGFGAPLPWLAAEIVDLGGALEAPAEGFDEGEPLRSWVALDGSGAALAVGEGRTFVPPAGTVEVEVEVGGQVWLSAEL